MITASANHYFQKGVETMDKEELLKEEVEKVSGGSKPKREPDIDIRRPIPARSCPSCGSTDLNIANYPTVKCNACGNTFIV